MGSKWKTCPQGLFQIHWALLCIVYSTLNYIVTIISCHMSQSQSFYNDSFSNFLGLDFIIYQVINFRNLVPMWSTFSKESGPGAETYRLCPLPLSVMKRRHPLFPCQDLTMTFLPLTLNWKWLQTFGKMVKNTGQKPDAKNNISKFLFLSKDIL